MGRRPKAEVLLAASLDWVDFSAPEAHLGHTTQLEAACRSKDHPANDMGSGERDGVELADVTIPGAWLIQPVFCSPALGRR
jgi:hypothetical protein